MGRSASARPRWAARVALGGWSLQGLTALVAGVLLLGFLGTDGAYAQNGHTQKVAYDTIFLTSGRKYLGVVKNISGSKILYTDTLNQERSFLERNVQKIVYANGKAMTFNAAAVESVSESDWRIVILTEDPKQVEGLFPRGHVFGESNPKNKSLKSAQRSAETRIKKRAVAKKGLVVLVSRRLKTGGYGEIPSYRIEGEVYGTEPLPEGETGDEPGETPEAEGK